MTMILDASLDSRNQHKCAGDAKEVRRVVKEGSKEARKGAKGLHKE